MATVLAIAGLSVGAVAPALEDASPVQNAAATGVCLYGPSSHCIIPIDCVVDMPPCDRDYP